MRWKVYAERTLYEHRWVRLVLVDIEPPSGERWWHHVVRLNRVAIAVVLDDADRVLMLWRHRFATDEWGWELPGGIVDGEEDSATTAAREVEEETGWRPHAPLRKLLEFQPMPGMVDTPHELFLAHGADKIGEPTDAEEAGVVSWIPMADVPALIARGEVLGSGSLVGLLLVMSRLKPEGREDT
ncbi:NUDIX hydrolase [Flindersiella endophytica]